MNTNQIVDLISLRNVNMFDRFDTQVGLVIWNDETKSIDIDFLNDDKLLEYKGLDEKAAKFLIDGLRILRGMTFRKSLTGAEILEDLLCCFG